MLWLEKSDWNHCHHIKRIFLNTDMFHNLTNVLNPLYDKYVVNFDIKFHAQITNSFSF